MLRLGSLDSFSCTTFSALLAASEWWVIVVTVEAFGRSAGSSTAKLEARWKAGRSRKSVWCIVGNYPAGGGRICEMN